MKRCFWTFKTATPWILTLTLFVTACSINPATGEISVADGAALNFEDAASHAILLLPAGLKADKWPDLPGRQPIQDGLKRWPRPVAYGG